MKRKLVGPLLASILILFAGFSLSARPDCEVRIYDDFLEKVWNIHRVSADSVGFIWIATSNGLYRYDGHEFVNFPIGNIRKLYTDQAGNFWCLIDNRVYVFDIGSYRYRDILKDYEATHSGKLVIQKLRVKSDGSALLVADDGTCLAVSGTPSSPKIVSFGKFATDRLKYTNLDMRGHLWLQDGDFVRIISPDGSEEVLDITVRSSVDDRDGRWILSSDGSLYFFDFSSGKLVKDPVCEGNPVSALRKENGCRIIGSTRGVFICKDGEGFRPVRGCESADDIFIDSRGECRILPPMKFISEDRFGTVWCLRDDDTFGYLDSTTGDLIPYDLPGVDPGKVRIFRDPSGNLWMWSLRELCSLTFRQPPYTSLRVDGTGVRTIFRNPDGTFWVSEIDAPYIRVFSPGNELLGFLGKDGRVHKEKTEFFAKVYAIFRDRDNNIWIGTKPSGIYLLRPGGGDGYTVSNFMPGHSDGLNTGEIVGFAQDLRGRLWIAGYGGGINCIPDPGAREPRFLNCDNCFSIPPSFSRQIRGITVTSRGALLASSPVGLYVADTNIADLSRLVVKEHTADKDRPGSLSGNAIKGIFETRDGEIFISTENAGLNQLLSSDIFADTLRFRNFTEAEGLPSNIALSVFEDLGLLWVTGLSRLTGLAIHDDRTVINEYFRNSGLTFSDAIPVHIDGSRYLMGLTDGCIEIDLRELVGEINIPEVMVASVRIDNRPVIYPSAWPDEILLDKDERNLRISFTALDFASGGDVDFDVSIESTDGSYKYTGQRLREISLINLPPGHYILRVRANGIDGASPDLTRTIKIKVTPRFSETLWARLLFILAALALVAGVILTVRYIINIKRQQAETLQKYLSLLDSGGGSDSGEAPIPAGGSPLGPSAATPPAKTHLSDPQDDLLIKNVIQFIEQHISDTDIYIDDMAAHAAVSRSLLNKKIKNLLGRTPVELIREARIKRACSLLADKSRSVSEIGLDCGFSDTRYFSKCFKQSVGLTPLEYRKKIIV